MPAVKTATAGATAAASTTTRLTRTRRAAATATADADSLASDLDRVLKVSQPAPQPKAPTRPTSVAPTKRTVSASKVTTTAATKTATAKPAPAPRAASTTAARAAATKAGAKVGAASASGSAALAPSSAPTRTRVRTTAAATTAAPTATGTRAKAKATKPTEHEPPAPVEAQPELPWVKAGAMSARERAQAAQQASNEALRTLIEALKAGFKYSTPPAKAAAATSAPAITHKQVDEALRHGMAAVNVLRELYGGVKTGPQRLAVERGAFNIVFKCVCMEMHKQALLALGAAKPHVVGLYSNNGMDQAPAPSTATSGSAKPKTPPVVRPEWRDLAIFPRPTDDVDEAVRTLVCNFSLATWSCLLSLEGMDADTVSSFLAIPSTTPDPLSPFVLAPSLPATAVGSLAVILYRRASAIPSTPATRPWLLLREVTAFATAIAASEQSPTNAPSKVWSSVGRTVQLALEAQADDAWRKEVAASIERMVDIMERLVASRQADRSTWFGGVWPKVADLWIGIGRNLNDSAIIDSALDAATAAASISSGSAVSAPSSSASSSPASTAPSTPVSVTSARSLSRAVKTVRKIDNAGAETLRICASLAKALVDAAALAKLDSPPADTLQAVLEGIELDNLLAALCSVEPSDEYATIADALRAVERVRRVVVKLIDRPALSPIARQWLLDQITFFEGLLVQSDDKARGQNVVRDCLLGVVDSTQNLARAWDPAADELFVVSLLERVYALCETCSMHAAAARLQYLACLTQTDQIAAIRLLRINAKARAAPLARRACTWSVAILDSCGDDREVAAQTPAWRSIESALQKRFDLLGICLHDSDKNAALVAYAQSLAYIDIATVQKIESAIASTPVCAVFASLDDYNVSLKRCTALLTQDDPLDTDFAAVLFAELASRNLSTAVRGAIAERVIESLEHAQFRPHVQTTIVALVDGALALYDAATYALRRMRVCVRLLSLIAASGAVPERFNSVGNEVDSLAQKGFNKDGELACFKAEYHASALVLRALNAYHSETEPSTAVADLGHAALRAISATVLPPVRTSQFPAATGRRTASRTVSSSSAATRTASRTTKTATSAPTRTRVTKATATKTASAAAKGSPAKSATAAQPPQALRTDSVERLSQLLNALSSLFGLLGHVLPKLETLKVLRALQRHNDGTVDAFIYTSSHLATEYGRLGKYSRASVVFAHAIKQASDEKSPASIETRADLHLSYARFLAVSGHVENARDEYLEAENLATMIADPVPAGSYAARWIQLCAVKQRIALLHSALAAIRLAEGDVTAAINSLTIAYRLWCRAAHGISHIAAAAQSEQVQEETEVKEAAAPADPKAKKPQAFALEGKHLTGLQWHYAEALFDSAIELVNATAQRGSVKESEYFIRMARGMVPSMRSSALDARVASHSAELETRQLHFEKSAEELERAAGILTVTDGPDAIEIRRMRGELFSRQQEAPEADEQFISAVENIVGLDTEFVTVEEQSRKDSVGAAASSREPLLPHVLSQVLRQRAWLLHEAGIVDEYESIREQLDLIPASAGTKAQQQLLEARVAMQDAFGNFKTDLFMSSLTESTIAMTMGSPDKRAKERQSTRHGAQVLLERAAHAFRDTLANVAATGRVEDVRQACVSLALLGAFQTSLGQVSATTTASAAGMLASIPSLTLERELLPAIDSKFPNAEADDMDWPSLERQTWESDDPMRPYWDNIRAKYATSTVLHTEHDLSGLPANWAVVSITVTDDRNTMLVSRHQNGHEPIVFCIPLDRQGRREGEDESELFTFDAGITELGEIMAANDEQIKGIKNLKHEDRPAWWEHRKGLDARLGELLASIEFCWLGAFKTVLNPRMKIEPKAFDAFRDRLDRIFQAALSSAGSEIRKGARVRLNDELLACFATLSSQCKDEEVEDLVYFVLDLYQFHGIAVALAELDFDQIGVDVKSAIIDLEIAMGITHPVESDEHLLLALDKNVQGIPWESIPSLRGRAVSRIPSLPFVLDQIALGQHCGVDSAHRTFDRSKTSYFLNPSGDLVGTQKRFEERLTGLEKKGWKGIVGRVPSQAEMADALRESEFVIYYGHGGGEEYIRGLDVRALPRCAVTMLWGCSSGLLRDYGDLDRTGTPWDYVLAGCPCFVGNLWDVTDKDIDLVTALVMDDLGLDAEHVDGHERTGVSVVQAVSAARPKAKLKYLTGAAPVVYGVPVYPA